MRIGTSTSNCREYPGHHSKRPAARDHHPTGAFRFRVLEQDVRYDAVAQQNQYERTHELTKTLQIHSAAPFAFQSTQSNERLTARFHTLYISSRFPFFRFGVQV